MATVRRTKSIAVFARAMMLVSLSFSGVNIAPASAAPAHLPSTAATQLPQPLWPQPDWDGVEGALSASMAESTTGLAPAPATGRPALPGDQGSSLDKVETSVLNEMAASSQADFFIWMTEKADLGPAYQLKTKEEKGRFVFEALRATAERTQKALRVELDAQGVDYQPFYIANKMLVKGGNQTLLLNIASHPDVARITANHKFQLEEPIINPSPPVNILAVESNISFVNADDVWAMGYSGAGTVLAGNDTGLDWDHPALINQYRGWNGVIADHNYNWWDATGTYPNVPNDGHGHGTHTTGTMVGSDGGANRIGMAPGARTIHCKNMDDWGGGSEATFTECFEWDLAPWDLNGANPRPDLAPDAINNSWGYWGGNYPAFEDEIAALQAAGILVEVSAGNSGWGCASLGSPADYRQVLTTGSVDHVSGVLPGTLSWFSSRGPSALYPADYIPDVMAPGENIRSSVPGGGYDGGWSGTSMAGPHVTGLVGLMWSANPGLRGMVTPTMQIIFDTAVPLAGQFGSNCGGNYADGPNNDWGYGSLDALAAVRQATLYGGAGTLTGTVTDGLVGVPGAALQASLSPTLTWRATSDALGNYSMRVLSGTYAVTASAYSYYPATAAGVSVISGTTTTLNIALTPAPTYVVSGTVTDAGTGWPLYASLDIEGYPGGTIWTDPVSGSYRIVLAAGTGYTFKVAAAHYAPGSRAVGPLTGDETQNFALRPPLGGGCPPGDDELTLFQDSFESWTLGSSWNTFTTNEGRVQISAVYPHIGSRSALLDDSTGDSNFSTAAIILTRDLSGWSQVNLDFWWREFDDEDDPEDGVFISDDRGAHWYRAFSFNNGPNAFRHDIIDISAAADASGLALNDHFQIKFQFYGDYPVPVDGYAIDDVRLESCAPSATGRMVGHVYDANTSLPLGGALVAWGKGQNTTADANGVYILFDTPGTHTYTATMRGRYIPNIQTVSVVQGSTVQQDFHLPAGRLSYAPPALEATLDMGISTTVPFTLSNSGAMAATFELWEGRYGFLPEMTSSGPFTASEPLVPPKSQAAATTQGLALPPTPAGAVLDAGHVIQSWPSGLAAPWGIGFNTMNNDLWLGSIAYDGGDDLDHRFLTDGARTGDTIDTAPWVGYFAADMTYNPLTGMLWQMNVGGDDCIHEMDPLKLVSTGNRLCPGWSYSQRGLAYDPFTATYFAGSWNDGMVYHFAADGVMLDQAFVGLGIAGLAYNPDTQHLFVMVNDYTNRVFVLDTARNYALVGQFNVGAGFGPYAGAGLEMDCEGNLWAVDQATRIVYQFESGEATTMCKRDVPWLSEAPITGTLVAGGSAQVIEVTFDASVPEITQPGQYYAELRIRDDTPYALSIVPVMMTVNPLASWGKLGGTVRGLGYCDAAPTPLKGAQVLIEGSHGLTWTLTTDISGTYGIWLDEVLSPLTVTVTYTDHEMGRATSVALAGQATTSLDFNLRWLQSCLSVHPTGLSATFEMGQTATQAMTVTNSGAATTNFRIAELDGGHAMALLSTVQVPGYQPPQEARPAFAAQHLAAREGWSYQPRTGALLGSTPADIVLVAAADATQIKAMLQAYPDINRVDYFDARLATPTLGQLLAYDTVIVMANEAFANPVALGDVLADYIDAGGTIVQSVPSFYDPSGAGWGLRGRFVAAGYSPFVGTGDRLTWANLGNFDGSHPIMRGVTHAGDSLRQMVTLGAGAKLVAEWSDDEFVATKGSVVALNTFLADGYVWTGDVDLIVHNSIVWLRAGIVAWLSETPTTGLVGADGRTQTVEVAFDSSMLIQPGEYHATLNVGSNDPLSNPIGVPVTMTLSPPATWGKLTGTITSWGYCDAAMAPLEDAQVFIQSSREKSWTLTTDAGGVYELWLDQAHSPLTVTVTYPDYGTGQASGVTVTGHMTTTQDLDLHWQQPCVGVNPAGMSVTLDRGQTTTRTLTITNGGVVPSDFTLVEVSRGSEISTAQLLPAAALHSAGRVNVVSESRKGATVGGPVQSLKGGGPDPFGYVYRDSNDPDGPVYAWIEIAPPAGGNGIPLGMSGVDDGYFWPLQAPFDFRFYGSDYNRLAVSSNGALYFEDAYLGLVNAPIPGPSGDGVDTFIAFWWDDLVISPGDVYYEVQDGVLIIEYYQVMQWATSGEYGTWEMILFENGNILFQYQDVTIGDSGNYGGSATVGIQGSTTAGLQYSYNTSALSDNLAVCFAYPGLPPDCSSDVPWLSEDPSAGTVAADGGTQLVNVTFDAGELTQPGVYYATLRVNSDDPLYPHTSIPVTMTIRAQASRSLIRLPLIQKNSQ